MATLINSEDFLLWETETLKTWSERVAYYDPRIDRAYLLYADPKTKKLSPEYIMSDGEDLTGKHIIFRYSSNEGPFRSVENLQEFIEQAELLRSQDPLAAPLLN